MKYLLHNPRARSNYQTSMVVELFADLGEVGEVTQHVKYLSKKCREISVPRFMEVQMTSLQVSVRCQPENQDLNGNTDNSLPEADCRCVCACSPHLSPHYAPCRHSCSHCCLTHLRRERTTHG